MTGQLDRLVTLRIASETWEAIADASRDEGRTRSEFVRDAVEKALDARRQARLVERLSAYTMRSAA